MKSQIESRNPSRTAVTLSTTLLTASLAINAFADCAAPPSGLVSWWRGEGNALDQVGTNNGSLAGNTTYGAGRVGQCFVLDGNGDAVVVGNPTSLRLQDFTIEAWIRRGSATRASLNSGGGLVFRLR